MATASKCSSASTSLTIFNIAPESNSILAAYSNWLFFAVLVGVPNIEYKLVVSLIDTI